MRKTTIAFLLLGWTSILTAAGFEARSKHHGLAIDAHDFVYDIVVTDLDTNQVLLAAHPTTQVGSPITVSNDVGDQHITVTLSPKNGALMTLLEVEQGDILIDSISTTWGFTPRRAHLRAPGAMRVGGEVKAPVVVHRAEPIYPEEARRARVSGVVILEALVDKTGVVKDALVLKP